MNDLLGRVIESPIGPLCLVGNAASQLLAVRFPRQGAPDCPPGLRIDPGYLQQAACQFAEYFDGRRQRFELPLAPRGTPFQRQVWVALGDIPFGETESYAGLARRIGRASAVRAVGAANGRNPLPIILPCHRVIGTDGSLTGFGGGLPVKAWLLRHEAECAGRGAPRQAMLFE